MTTELRQALKSLQCFGSLTDSVLDQLTSFTSTRIIRAGETVFCQGEPSPYCFGILSGEVMFQHVSKDRRFAPKILGTLGPGSLFGESSIFEDTARTAMASACQDGKLVAVRGSHLRDWITRNPEAGQPLLLALLKATAGRLHRTSLELAVIDGLGRLLGTDKPFLEQLAAALEFLKGSLDGLDDLIFYQRDAGPEKFTPVISLPVLQDLPAIPFQNELVQQANSAGEAHFFAPKNVQEHLAAFKLPWEERAGMVIIPLYDGEKARDSLAGLLCLASQHNDQIFSAEKRLLLTSVSGPLAEALVRRTRQARTLGDAP